MVWCRFWFDFYRFTVANPVSSPSRTALLTGNYPARFSIHSAISTHKKNAMSGMPDWLDPKVTLLPRLLKDAGYNIARRTVAKYREQLAIPVARLRKEM